ncbi:MAG TPA: Ig-like domain-containing protein [Longimicrobium sp.]|nr:Ig-like domain-containing protein [Longimicrobium sp.]
MRSLKAAGKWGALLALALAACDRNPAANADTTLLLEPDHLQLYVGESAPALGQLLRNGHDIPSEGIVYWSGNTSVATVSPTGLVTARLPGDTWVRARYGELLDSLVVTVLSDSRAELQVLDLIPGEVQAATQSGPITIRYVALDGYGRTRCTPYGFTTRMDPFILRASVVASETGCWFVVTPGAEGETWLVAAVQGLSDSVRVKVANGAYQVQFTDSTVISAQAGVPAPVSVRMLDPRGRPAAGQSVWFTASPGRLAQTTATTDSTGTATVLWTPPGVLAAGGGSGVISFRALFPTGAVAGDGRTVPLVGGAPARVEWFAGNDGRMPVGARSLVAALHNFLSVSAAGRDASGNQTQEAPGLTFVVLSGAAPGKTENRGNTCEQNLPDPNGMARYLACYASYRFLADSAGAVRVYAAFPGGPRDSLDVTFR